MTNKRTLIIGIDGANWQLLNSLIEINQLPTLKKLKEKLNHSVLESTIPPLTGPAWITFATGKNPGEHGCFGFTLPEQDLDTTKAIDASKIKTPTFYERLSANNQKCILVNLPGSYPPKTNNITVTSLLTRGDEFFFPKEKREEYSKLLKNYKLVPDPKINQTGAFIRELLSIERARFKLGKKLFQQEEWLVFFYLFSASDWVNHKFYSDMLTNPKHPATVVYQHIDEYLGWFIENKDEDTNLIVMSDHGFKSYQGAFYINEWLKKEGYLKYSHGNIQHAAHERRQAETQRAKGTPLINLDLRKEISFLKNIPFLFKVLKELYQRFQHLLPIGVEERTAPDINKSRAYYLGGAMGIYLNDRKRFRNGVLSAEEKEHLRDEIITKLRNLQDPAGDNLFKSVMPKEEVYEGEETLNAPDIVFELNNYWPKSGSGPLFLKENLNNHHKHGILLADVNIDNVTTLQDIIQLIINNE